MVECSDGHKMKRNKEKKNRKPGTNLRRHHHHSVVARHVKVLNWSMSRVRHGWLKVHGAQHRRRRVGPSVAHVDDSRRHRVHNVSRSRDAGSKRRREVGAVVEALSKGIAIGGRGVDSRLARCQVDGERGIVRSVNENSGSRWGSTNLSRHRRRVKLRLQLRHWCVCVRGGSSCLVETYLLLSVGSRFQGLVSGLVGRGSSRSHFAARLLAEIEKDNGPVT
jgi:hypothetical protein